MQSVDFSVPPCSWREFLNSRRRFEDRCMQFQSGGSDGGGDSLMNGVTSLLDVHPGSATDPRDRPPDAGYDS